MRWLLALLWFLLPVAVQPVDIYPAQPDGIRIEWAAEQPPEMATVTKTVAASGADYTTIAAALAWFVANHDFDTDGIARILITDATSYTISSGISLTGISGTPDIDGYLEITSNASDPFAGPTLNMTHSGDGGFKIYQDFTYIHNLLFHLNNTNSSTECIRVHDGADNVLISRNVFLDLTQTAQQDGIYTGNWAVSNLRIDHNVFVGFHRGSVHLQLYSGTSTQSVDFRFNSFAWYMGDDDKEGGFIAHIQEAGATINATLYNNLGYEWGSGPGSYGDTFFESGEGTHNWTGSNNITHDISAEGKFTSSYDSVTFTESEPSSGENAWLTEIDNADETLVDLSIAGENAYTVTGNGVDQTGSEPDSRQDFSIDIMGNARHATTPDIGAFEFSAGGTSIPATLMINGQIKQYTDESPNSPLCLETDGSIQAYSDVTGKTPLVIENGAQRVLAAGETLLH